jgi:hypothetical protein
MSLYQEFSALLPYLQSVRKMKNYLSFDVSFPNTWKIPKKYVEEDKIMEQQPINENERLFSYITEISENGVQKVYSNLKSIIKYNLEREAKDKLFETKVEELKKIFEKQNLEKLMGLSFEITEQRQKIKLEDDEESVESGVDKLVREPEK